MDETLSLHDVIHRAYKTFGVFGGEKPRLIPSGIGPIDEKMGGIMPGTLWFIGARTNVGKSTLMHNMAYCAASAGYKVLYISGEDPESLVGGKLQSRFSGIPLIELSRHGYSLAGDHGVRRALEESKKLSLFACFPKKRTLESIRELILQSIEELSPDIIYYDYLTTVSPSSRFDLRAFYTEVIMTMRTIALRSGVPIVCGSQVTRRPGEVSDNYEIQMRELAETGNIENFSDVVLLVWSDEDGSRRMKVAKNKIAGHVKPRMTVAFDPRTEVMNVEESFDK